MQESRSPVRTLTELDHVRLQNLIRRHAVSLAPGEADMLGGIIDNADLVSAPHIPPDLVTMKSRVVICNSASGATSTLTLAYPDQAEPAKGHISVLSPIGTGLLGLHIGATARWHGPDGLAASAKLEAIEFQPEASGDYLA